MKRQGIFIIISGFSGAGKGTIVKKLIDENKLSLSISATTRPVRKGEVDGEHYYFTQKEAFENMINNNELIEWASYCDNYYGTPKKYVMNELAKGEDVILEIEMNGALQVKKQFPEALLVFVTAPSAQEIKNRLIKRGTESSELIQKRLIKSYQEIDSIDDYDYIVVNDGLEKAVSHIHSIIVAEHERASRNKDIKQVLKKEFEELLKGEI